MIATFNRSFYKNGYLLIIAAWLYTISFIFSNYWLYASAPDRVKTQLENYLKKNETVFESFVSDFDIQNRIINGNEAVNNPKYLNNQVSLFTYIRNSDNLSLVYWNTNKVLPDSKDLNKPDGKYFTNYSNGEFEFIKKTYNLKDRQIVSVGIIPVRWNYFFENKYLRTEFAALENIEKRYDIVASNADVYIRNGDGKVLCGLKEKKIEGSSYSSPWPFTLRILAIIFILVFLHVYATDIVQKKGLAKGILFLVGAVVFLRLLTYIPGFPFNYRSLPLFDPIVYASNLFHPSLGDLFINIVLIFWLISFSKFAAINYLKNFRKITGNKGWFLSLLLSAFLIVLAFVCAGITRSLVSDSQIPLDVTNFFSLNIYTPISFIILYLIIISFFHLSQVALLFIYKSVNVPPYVKYLFIAVLGLLYLSVRTANYISISNLIVLGWLLLYTFIMEFRKEDIFVPIIRSSIFLIWLIFFAASISALIISQNRKVELEERKKVAEKVVSQVDPTAINPMTIGITEIDSNFLSANLNRLQYETTNKLIKDSLINEFFSGYLNKFDARLYTYDKNYTALYNDDSASFQSLIGVIVNRGIRTDYPGLYYYENPSTGSGFFYYMEINDLEGAAAGYFFVVAEPKEYKSQTVYPELFKQGSEYEPYQYSYAIYNKGRLVAKVGDYNFKSFISKDDYLKQEFKEVVNDENSELWYNGGNNKMAIIVRTSSLFFEFITMFAYLFGSFLFIVVVFRAGQLLVRYRFSINRLRSGLRLNIRRQIQAAIIFISIFSFLVIGIATISFYIARFRQTNRERLVKTINVLADEIEERVASNNLFNHGTSVLNIEVGSGLENTLKEIAETHDVEANFYDLNGNLKVSTQPYIYKKQVLSKMMEPRAFHRLHYNNDIQYIQQEHVSHFSFLSIYVPVKDAEGTPYAYLNIPYLNTQKELNQEISNFLVTLICLNAIIFVIAGVISVLLTNRITNSFTLIAAKMRAINLGKANEEIQWSANDEIGALVSEYNKMVKKLEESAQALAKSEREGAWREMARQVAHEIKNPLTPMKLSIQYLQRAIQEKRPNIEEFSKNVSATLIEQIDQLAKIASDFSQFANIGNVKMEVFNVNEILQSLINLYGSNQKLEIIYNHPKQPALINADKTQINRLFTNLFQNAIEASEGQEKIYIIINETINVNKLQIDITDKGSGIPEEKQQKIFTPNFTTKSSGTGLGLAICKGIVEKANGRIWFDTIEGEGTTFHVLLPIVGLPA